MATADVARLRFVMSADSGGLKAGCKDASGSLKDMESQTRQSVGRMDGQGIDWKGIKKSARSLKFVGREMGGMFKGAIGDVMGMATAGMGMGKLGGAMAIGAIGTNLVMEHFAEEERKRQEEHQKAFATVHGAASHGISATKYRELETIAAGDDKFLSDMADTMKQLADAGPGASAALKSLGREIGDIKGNMGIRGEHAKTSSQQMLIDAGEERMKKLGFGRDSWGGINSEAAHALKQHAYDKLRKSGLSDKEAKKQLASRLSKEGFDPLMAEWEKDAEQSTQKAEKRGALLQDPNLKTNKEKLNEKLHQIGDTQKDIDADKGLSAEEKASYREKSARAAQEAIEDYKKAQHGGAVGMAGAAESGSAEAYSVIAQARMGAQGAENDTATTNALLEKNLPELIDAVKSLNPNWRKADVPG
jgi:hypothetical protein